MTVTLRPGTREDIIALLGSPPDYRCKVVAAECDGKVIGLGGIVYCPDGLHASMVITDQFRASKFALHRAVARWMKNETIRSGYRRIVAHAEPGNPAAERWLQRLGYRPETVKGETVWVWQQQDARKQ